MLLFFLMFASVALFFFFFFQAEDGIRDLTVTGVQTCALPISPVLLLTARRPWRTSWFRVGTGILQPLPVSGLARSGRPRHPRGKNTRRYQDRKSTRLNSSHSQISYAVFCLKKKKKNQIHILHNTSDVPFRESPTEHPHDSLVTLANNLRQQAHTIACCYQCASRARTRLHLR